MSTERLPIGWPPAGESIVLTTPVPCGTTDGLAYCCRPATVAIVQSHAGGVLVLLPICRECVHGMARNYGIDKAE